MSLSKTDHRVDAAGLWAEFSHDLRQPIQALLLLMHVAARTQERDVLQRTLGYMEHGLLAMQEMIEAIGLLSRLEAGIATTARQATALSDLIAEVDTEIGNQLAGRKIQIEVGGGATVIEGDRALLAMVLRGLVTMAAMASADDAVTIRARRVAGQVSVTCAYHGGAISAAQRKAYFSETPPRAGEPRGGGIVLGLAFVERLAAALGWEAAAGTGPKGMHKLVLSQVVKAKGKRAIAL